MGDIVIKNIDTRALTHLSNHLTLCVRTIDASRYCANNSQETTFSAVPRHLYEESYKEWMCVPIVIDKERYIKSY